MYLKTSTTSYIHAIFKADSIYGFKELLPKRKKLTILIKNIELYINIEIKYVIQNIQI
jgi:hypothetical protein